MNKSTHRVDRAETCEGIHWRKANQILLKLQCKACKLVSWSIKRTNHCNVLFCKAADRLVASMKIWGRDLDRQAMLSVRGKKLGTLACFEVWLMNQQLVRNWQVSDGRLWLPLATSYNHSDLSDTVKPLVTS